MKCADMFRKHKPYLHSTADQVTKNYSPESKHFLEVHLKLNQFQVLNAVSLGLTEPPPT